MRDIGNHSFYVRGLLISLFSHMEQIRHFDLLQAFGYVERVVESEKNRKSYITSYVRNILYKYVMSTKIRPHKNSERISRIYKPIVSYTYWDKSEETFSLLYLKKICSNSIFLYLQWICFITPPRRPLKKFNFLTEVLRRYFLRLRESCFEIPLMSLGFFRILI